MLDPVDLVERDLRGISEVARNDPLLRAILFAYYKDEEDARRELHEYGKAYIMLQEYNDIVAEAAREMASIKEEQ